MSKKFGAERLTQVFRNNTSRPQVIILELSASQYRLEAGEQLMLHYDPTPDPMNECDASLIVEFVQDTLLPTIVIWTKEVVMFRSDGQPAEMIFDSAP